jgi:hypothetical protein
MIKASKTLQKPSIFFFREISHSEFRGRENWRPRKFTLPSTWQSVQKQLVPPVLRENNFAAVNFCGREMNCEKGRGYGPPTARHLAPIRGRHAP